MKRQPGHILYVWKIQEEHIDLVASDRGLVVDPKYLFMGATPDGFITCSCCRSGVIEVKCPFSCKDKSFLESAFALSPPAMATSN